MNWAHVQRWLIWNGSEFVQVHIRFQLGLGLSRIIIFVLDLPFDVGMSSWAPCTPCISWPDANISCGIFDAASPLPRLPVIAAAAAAAVEPIDSACVLADDEPKLKLSGEFKHVADDRPAAKPTRDAGIDVFCCCCIDAKFWSFCRFNILCTGVGTRRNGETFDIVRKNDRRAEVRHSWLLEIECERYVLTSSTDMSDGGSRSLGMLIWR